MLDIKFIRENPEKVKEGISAKGYNSSLIDKVLKIDEEKRKLQLDVENLRAEKNKIAEEASPSASPSPGPSDDLHVKGKKVKEELQKKDTKLTEVGNKLNEILQQIPNLPLPQTPIGKDESENKEVRKWGEPKKFDFTPKDHLELGKNLGILDFETGAKVSGSQFYFLYGDAALMELALIQYAMERLSKEGFTPVITPDLAKSRYYIGTGYLPKGNEAQTYTVEDEDLGLIATAEVTLAGKHADETISEDKLPIKYLGYSHCFRKEAGAYGRYSKGLYRVHQFTKAEMFIYSLPEESNKLHEYLLQMEEKIYQELGLPYRIKEMCTGDLSAMSARTFDLEVWMPSRNEYGEVTSTSNCSDYQARNLNIKFRKKNGETGFVHMINGTAIATSRTPLAILENYQNEDGSVTVPEVLRKWMGKDRIEKM